ncbi:MAG: DUF58 domain-containing protein [Actinobacteria bacterium]|nr:DUF58 domain-containing protein [Actinomycetota bacterium]
MPTRQGWTIAFGGLAFIVTGRVLGSLELFLVGATLLALVLLCSMYVGLTRLRIDVTRELHPPRVHAGSPSRVDLRVENIGRRRTPVLGLRDAVSGTRGANLLVGPLATGEVERAAYRLPTDKRGILEIGPLRVVLTDPFTISRVTMTASGVSELTVYPHIDTLTPVPLTTGNDPMAGAEHPNALGRSGEDFYALRQYQVGDDLRRVHWASTAKHDELMVRQDELPWQGRATVLADIRAAANTPASLELVISAAASVVTASARRQDLVRLLTTDGSDSGFAAGHAHVESIMEHLASVEASHDAAFRRVIARAARSSTGGALIAIVATMASQEIEQLARLRQRFGSVTIVQFDPSSWNPHAPAPADSARSNVLRVTANKPFAELWNGAMRRTRQRPSRDKFVPDPAYDPRTSTDEPFDPFSRRAGMPR